MIAGMDFSALRTPLARPRILAPAAVIATLLSGCGLLRPAPPAPAAVLHRAEPPSDTGLPASAARALGQRFAAMHAVGHSSGRLQVADADDLAVVLAPLGQSTDAVVALLVTGAGGEYRVATASKVVAPGCETVHHHGGHRTPCWCTSMDRADLELVRVTYQFGYGGADDALRLVGVTAAQPRGRRPDRAPAGRDGRRPAQWHQGRRA